VSYRLGSIDRSTQDTLQQYYDGGLVVVGTVGRVGYGCSVARLLGWVEWSFAVRTCKSPAPAPHDPIYRWSRSTGSSTTTYRSHSRKDPTKVEEHQRPPSNACRQVMPAARPVMCPSTVDMYRRYQCMREFRKVTAMVYILMDIPYLPVPCSFLVTGSIQPVVR
jgi:hypothetical protein